MSLVQPLAPDEITDPELQALIRRGEALGVPDTLFPRILARVPGQDRKSTRLNSSH